jgi:hypothetical protein
MGLPGLRKPAGSIFAREILIEKEKAGIYSRLPQTPATNRGQIFISPAIIRFSNKQWRQH